MPVKNIDSLEYQDWYDGLDANPLIRWYQRNIKFKFLMPIFKYLKKDSTILDIGCARGEFLQRLYKLGYRNLSGMDIANALRPEIADKICFFEESITSPSFLDIERPKFDILVIQGVLHHLPYGELSNCVKNIAGITKTEKDFSCAGGGGTVCV